MQDRIMFSSAKALGRIVEDLFENPYKIQAIEVAVSSGDVINLGKRDEPKGFDPPTSRTSTRMLWF